MRDVVALAVGAGVDVVQVYPLDAGHGMRPTEAEQLRYYEDVLSGMDHQVALSVHTVVGYAAPADLVARVCKDYPQIVAVNLIGVSSNYLLDLRDAVRGDIAIYVPLGGFFDASVLGANGFLGAEANIIPHTCRRFADDCAAGDVAAVSAVYPQLLRFAQVVGRWAPSTARWVKMALRVLGLPGGNGGLRRPYLMPEEPELRALRTALLGLDLAEINALAGSR
jgi:dihydrodipicolinate synthase/N-acetylneuraminate lyase